MKDERKRGKERERDKEREREWEGEIKNRDGKREIDT